MNAAAPSNSSALYRAVWRWHFYAGIVVAPFAIFLAITGALYLWKPQYEDWRYRDLFNVPTEATTISADAQLSAARAAFPKATPIQFIPPLRAGRTAEVQFGSRWGKDKFSAFVNPHTGAVVGTIDEATRPMRILHDLHGTLLAGRFGETLVELAASWALVLLLTGLYLWWPRPRFAVSGFLLPRLRATGRTFWRDLHAVPAVWFSVGTLFMLSTGLLWTKAAGGWYRTLSAVIGQGTPAESNAGAHRSELTGWSPPLRSGLAGKIDALASTPDEHAGHEGHNHSGAAAMPREDEAFNAAHPSISLARVIAAAEQAHVPRPYAIAFPIGSTGVFSVLSDRNQAFNRTYLHLDRYSGKILADVRYADFGYLAKFFGWGIIAHEGQLFGLANQVLGTLAALGVLLLAASGLVMWWQRRPEHRFATAEAVAPLPRPVFLGVLALACLLPLLAATFATSLVVDWLVRRRTLSAAT